MYGRGSSAGNSEAWTDGTMGGCKSNKLAPPWSFHLCLADTISSLKVKILRGYQ